MASNFICTEKDPSYLRYTQPGYRDRTNAYIHAAYADDLIFRYPQGVQQSTGEPNPPKAATSPNMYVNHEEMTASIEGLIQSMISKGASTEDCLTALLQAADNMNGRQ